MPLLILLLSLIISSCGRPKDNAMRGEQPYIARGENKVFLSLEHPHDASLLRQKLLNTVVQSALKEPLRKTSDKIFFRDEFIINNTKRDILAQDEVIYKENELWMSKVIVSYQDRLEVYFVPDQILISRLVAVLNLKADADREFLWVNPHLSATAKGSTFYLLSFNHDDLIANDESFYQEEYDWGADYSTKELNILKNQKLEILVNYNFMAQTGVPQRFKGSNSLKCSWEYIESGTFCGQHYYTRIVNGGSFEKAQMNDLAKLGLDIEVGKKFYNPTQLNAHLVSDGFFKISVNPSELVDLDSYRIAFKAFTPPAYIKKVMNYDLTPGCNPIHTSATEAFSAQSSFKIRLKVIGRGERLRSIFY
jgi:hypothetical protein